MSQKHVVKSLLGFPTVSADGSGPHNFEDINPNGLRVSSFIVREDEYCATIGSVQDFANVNKEVWWTPLTGNRCLDGSGL